ncbi:hypothetical protein BDY21DRAFT_7565 [Lineolata rhizophorae]|uniref:Uncharacterized protein n=1 Tax=Lineolata rhizophorae TaxID=578093 RepID=A0A6A6PDT6_9PEZI|nr:hypothetical protein BDY21DRAFT_7565 [Lineolata rhizophorae]
MASPGSEEEDEDLKHAIALSLGQEYVPSYRWQKRKASPLEGPPTKSRRDAAPSDKDDADLKSATAISLLMGVHAGPSSLGQEFKHPLHQVARGPCKFPGQIDFGAPKRIEDDMDSRNRKLGSGIGSSQSSQFHVDDSLRSKDTLGTKPATRSAPLAQPSVPKSSPTEANAELPNSAKFADENEEGDEDLKKAIALSLGHDISADCSPTILEASHKDSPVLGHSSTKRGTDPNQSPKIVEREKLKANPVPCVSPGAPYKSFSRSSLLSSFPPLSSVPSDQHQFVREARLRHFHNEGKDIQQEKMAGRQPPSDPGHNYAYPIMGMQRFFGQTGGLPAHARTGNANPAANTFNTANRIASGNQENVNIAQQQGLGRQYNDNAAIPQGNNFLAEYHSLGE